MRRNRLHNLIAANRGRGRFEVQASASGDEATLYLYDVIVSDDYWGGVSDSTFVQALRALDAPTIHVRINSPGGDVFAGRAMEQAIREHDSEIVVHIDGLAASAASYVAIAGDRVLSAPGAFVMVHKAWTIAWGNADDLVSTAALLEKIDGTLIDTYQARTGQERDTVAEWLAAETWFTADEALDVGLIDEVARGDDAGAGNTGSASSNAWDLSAYERAPQARVPVPPAAAAEPDRPAYAAGHTEHLRRRLALVQPA